MGNLAHFILSLPYKEKPKMIFYSIYIHIFCAFFSLGLFIIRALMQSTGKNWRTVKLLKILPHLSDTLLIASGIVLLVSFGVGLPWWILAKVALLIGYVLFATKGFKSGASNNTLFLLLALIAFIGAMLIGYNH